MWAMDLLLLLALETFQRRFFLGWHYQCLLFGSSHPFAVSLTEIGREKSSTAVGLKNTAPCTSCLNCKFLFFSMIRAVFRLGMIKYSLAPGDQLIWIGTFPSIEV